MPHHAAHDTATNDILASLESADRPSVLIELNAMAADANELAARIQAGQGTDLGELIRRSIEDRPGEAEAETLKTAA